MHSDQWNFAVISIKVLSFLTVLMMYEKLEICSSKYVFLFLLHVHGLKNLMPVPALKSIFWHNFGLFPILHLVFFIIPCTFNHLSWLHLYVLILSSTTYNSSYNLFLKNRYLVRSMQDLITFFVSFSTNSMWCVHLVLRLRMHLHMFTV